MKITGNADETFKQSMLDLPNFIDRTGRSRFGDSIIQGLVVTHASVDNKAEEPLKTEGKVICELVVTEDMLNGGGNVHGGVCYNRGKVFQANDPEQDVRHT
ncbi:hypothetical protein B0H14DRAFT_2623086 [Mycena olivaceomarginata]|nr:hypothetical protein B0H14DRAFT_2623086 [Mycena olivaceomarginata]